MLFPVTATDHFLKVVFRLPELIRLGLNAIALSTESPLLRNIVTEPKEKHHIKPFPNLGVMKQKKTVQNDNLSLRERQPRPLNLRFQILYQAGSTQSSTPSLPGLETPHPTHS